MPLMLSLNMILSGETDLFCQMKINNKTFGDSTHIEHFLAYPTGNIIGLNLPDAMGELKDVKSQWWFYVGCLTDNNQGIHSFELTFIEYKPFAMVWTYYILVDTELRLFYFINLNSMRCPNDKKENQT